MSKITFILVAIIAIGFILRLVGFNFEYLFNSISDETYQNSCILRMLEKQTLSLEGCHSPYPAFYVFSFLPSVAAGLVTVLFKAHFDLETLKQLMASYPLFTLPFIRIFNIIIGASQIFLIYQITKTLFNSRSRGLMAASLLSFSLLPVMLSHWARAWTLVLFFTLLAFYFGIRIYQEGQRKHYMLGALFVSSATGVHYGGFFSIIFIFCGHFFRKIRKLGVSAKNLYLSLAIIFLLSALWLFLNGAGVISMYSVQGFRGINIGDYVANFFLFLKYFLLFDPVVFLLVLAAIIFKFRKLLTFEYLFPILFFAFYLGGMIFLNLGPRIRWALPLIVILIPIAADLLGDLKNKIKSPKLYAVLIALVLLPSLFFSTTWDYILTLPNSRFAAKDWTEKNVPANSKILFLDETSVLAVSQEGAQYLEDALQGIRPSNPRYAYLAKNGQKVLPGYKVVNLQQFLDNRSFFAKERFDYYILSYSDESSRQEQLAFVPDLKGLALMEEFAPFNSKDQKAFDPEKDYPWNYLKSLRDIRMSGPYIEIYKNNL